MQLVLLLLFMVLEIEPESAETGSYYVAQVSLKDPPALVSQVDGINVPL